MGGVLGAPASAAQTAGEGGEKDPYGTLDLDGASTQSQIRKAYRRLSMQLHPDKHEGYLKADAELAFAELAAAYEILGSPDKRAAFDDFGGDNNEAFDTFAQYVEHMEATGQKSDTDFYSGDPLISTLDEAMWERRVSGNSIWLVEFYAPWCSACQKFAPKFRETAQLLEHDDVEAGGVNCAKDGAMCGDRFAIRSYPTVRLINRLHATQQEYHNTLGPYR